MSVFGWASIARVAASSRVEDSVGGGGGGFVVVVVGRFVVGDGEEGMATGADAATVVTPGVEVEEAMARELNESESSFPGIPRRAEGYGKGVRAQQ